MVSNPRRTRLALGRSKRRLSFERKVKLWILGYSLTTAIALAAFARVATDSVTEMVILFASVALVALLAGTIFFDQLIRPLQTLANIVLALREEDFSFRIRGTRRGDAMGDLALEVNALSSTLQQQRESARDALSLAERVMLTMASPVLVFDAERRLRLLNAAAERVFLLERKSAIGSSAEDIKMQDLFTASGDALMAGNKDWASDPGKAMRWSVARSTFRLKGIPHTLFLLTDVEAVLREEERSAWQKLIRVMGHEINNSLTPIKSIAGSLRSRIPDSEAAGNGDFARGLSIIEDRAESLNRFLQAYQRLSRLPPPRLEATRIEPILQQVILLETRLAIELACDADVWAIADSDQMQQMLINLVQNAVDAAVSVTEPAHIPAVEVICGAGATQITILIRDNGLGLTNSANLFVPFYTTKPNGTGIGLVLAQQIAAGHRGTVQLVNRMGNRGCEAQVTLPRLQRDLN